MSTKKKDVAEKCPCARLTFCHILYAVMSVGILATPVSHLSFPEWRSMWLSNMLRLSHTISRANSLSRHRVDAHNETINVLAQMKWSKVLRPTRHKIGHFGDVSCPKLGQNVEWLTNLFYHSLNGILQQVNDNDNELEFIQRVVINKSRTR